MSIKILSPKLTGTYIDYDSEKTLESIPDSVFSLDEFLGSDLFTSQEKSKHLQVLLDRGSYLLKLLDAYLAFHSPLQKRENNIYRLVRGIKKLQVAMNHPLGGKFYNQEYRRAIEYLEEQKPEKHTLSTEDFDTLNQIYPKLDQRKRIRYDDFQSENTFIMTIINTCLYSLIHDLAIEIGNYLTGALFFSRYSHVETFVVAPSIFQVLNGGFRKSIRGNEKIYISEEERVERVSSFYITLSTFLKEIKEASSMLVSLLIQNTQNNSVVTENLGPNTKDDDLKYIQNEKARQHIWRLEEMYPKFKIYRKELIKRGIIHIEGDGLHWNLATFNKTCYVLFWTHCAGKKRIAWKQTAEILNMDPDTSSYASLKYDDRQTCEHWITLQKILKID